MCQGSARGQWGRGDGERGWQRNPKRERATCDVQLNSCELIKLKYGHTSRSRSRTHSRSRKAEPCRNGNWQRKRKSSQRNYREYRPSKLFGLARKLFRQALCTKYQLTSSCQAVIRCVFSFGINQALLTARSAHNKEMLSILPAAAHHSHHSHHSAHYRH